MKDAYVSKSAGSEGKGFYHQLPIAIARPQTPTCAGCIRFNNPENYNPEVFNKFKVSEKTKQNSPTTDQSKQWPKMRVGKASQSQGRSRIEFDTQDFIVVITSTFLGTEAIDLIACLSPHWEEIIGTSNSILNDTKEWNVHHP